VRREPRPDCIRCREVDHSRVREVAGSAEVIRPPTAESRSLTASERSTALLAGNFHSGTRMGLPSASSSGWARKKERTFSYIWWNGSGFEAPEQTW
jgi:hypothetical protein